MSLEQNLKTIKDSELDIELLKRENEKECAERNGKIEKLQKVIEMVEENLETDLIQSGEKKLECKLGYCSFRIMPDKWEYDIPKLIIWAKENKERQEKYIKVVEEFKKAQFKTDLMVMKLDYGPVMDKGLTITPQEPKFNYKIK